MHFSIAVNKFKALNMIEIKFFVVSNIKPKDIFWIALQHFRINKFFPLSIIEERKQNMWNKCIM